MVLWAHARPYTPVYTTVVCFAISSYFGSVGFDFFFSFRFPRKMARQNRRRIGGGGVEGGDWVFFPVLFTTRNIISRLISACFVGGRDVALDVERGVFHPEFFVCFLFSCGLFFFLCGLSCREMSGGSVAPRFERRVGRWGA